jgi:hypothetical protein
MSEDNVKQTGFVFKPSLQDITLKRFRMRYSLLSDCYYLHWDDAACAALAKIEGLTKGVNSMNGLSRYCDNSSGRMFIGRNNGSKKAQITWKFDFSDCGLAVRQFRVKGRCSDSEDIEWRVIGDERVGCRPLLAATEDYIDIPEVYGCRVITVTAVMHQGSDQEPLQLLKGEEEGVAGDCPLDVKVDLMCPRSQEEGYVGEILLGIKWSPVTDGSIDDKLDGPRDGQLQVYVVEGAGMVDEDTHKPFNAFIKCNLLPEGKKEHTSPRQTAYPNWAKQFHFQHVERDDLVFSGLEVLLCNSHLLYSSTIAGIRLCVPQRRGADVKEGSPLLRSPVLSRSASPSSPLTFVSDECPIDSPSHPLQNSRHSSPSPTLLRMPSPSERSKSFGTKSQPKIGQINAKSLEGLPQSPVALPAFQRSLTPTPRSSSPSHVLSPPAFRRSRSPSPISIAKSIFRLSGSHLRDNSNATCPINSPNLGRKKFKVHQQRGSEDSEFVFSWMSGAGRAEVSHWQQMLDLEGEWVYCWHALRPNLKPVST